MREAQVPAFRTKIESTRTESSGAFATSRVRCNASFTIVAVLVAAFASFAPTPGVAQHAAPQPSFDPRQTERLFDSSQAPQRPDRRRPPLIIPGVTRPQPAADTKPLFNLTAVSVKGAVAIPVDAIAADLSTLPWQARLRGGSRGDRGGDHRPVSRCRLLPQSGHRSASGHSGWPDSHRGDRGKHHRGEVERRGGRAVWRRFVARGGSGRTPRAPGDARASDALDQRPARCPRCRYHP